MTSYSGKQVWTNLLEVTTRPVAADQVIALGELLTTNDDGYLVKATTQAGLATVFNHGTVQSFEKVDTTGQDDGDTEIQVALPRSRICIELSAGVKLNSPVETVNNSATKLKTAIGSPEPYTVIGTLFQIDEQPDKLVSEDGDFGIIDFGVGVQ